MKRAIAFTACLVTWPLAALVEGCCIPCAMLYAWAHDTRRDAGRGVRSLWGRR